MTNSAISDQSLMDKSMRSVFGNLIKISILRDKLFDVNKCCFVHYNESSIFLLANFEVWFLFVYFSLKFHFLVLFCKTFRVFFKIAF